MEDRFTALIATLVNDANVGLGVFLSNPRDGYAYAENYCSALIKAAQITDKPLALATNYSMADDRKIALRLKEAGIPLLRGTRNALLAIGHFMADREFRSRYSKLGEIAQPKNIVHEAVVSRWKFFNDKVAALAPFDCEAAKNLLSELRIARLLAGYRGKPAADMDGLARQLAQFSQMVALLGDTITEIDINPVICGPDGAVAVDCLVLTKAGVK